MTPAPAPGADPRRWQLPAVVALSAFWESLFLWKGSNLLDEGWALYAGMQLGMGRDLYDEIAWVFPPGHALPAWIGHELDPQGVLIPRLIYAGFAIALCAALYELGRKLSPPTWAFLGALLLAVAAPRSHMMHLLYGYRYMVFAVVVLLLFARRLETGDSRFTLLAGMVGGVCLFFRVTPALAVACAIAVAVLASSRAWQSWVRDWLAYSVGLLLVVSPALLWFGVQIGLDRLFFEVIVRPVEMLQPLPMPALGWPSEWTRETVAEELWHPVVLRVFLALYAAYAVALAVAWGRALASRRPFEHALLLAVVVWGGIFFVRSFGRADEAHMDTTLPPVCLLIGHGTGLVVERLRSFRPGAGAWLPATAAASVFLVWVLFSGADLYPRPHRFERTGLPGKVTSSVALLEEHTEKGEILLDLTASPMFHAISGRPGPGVADIVMEGTFVDPGEELRFITLLEMQPPAAVLWPVKHFDDMPSRALEVVAPRVAAWAEARYAPVGESAKFRLGVPKPFWRARMQGRVGAGSDPGDGSGSGDRSGDG